MINELINVHLINSQRSRV